MLRSSMTILLVICCYLINHSCDQEVPEKVVEGLHQKFPAARDIRWELESEAEWEGSFKLDTVEYSVVFREDGSWLETEHTISEQTLPLKIRQILIEKYPDFKLDEVELVQSQTELYYELEIEKGWTEVELMVDQEGNIRDTKNGDDD